ncbi:FeoB-associated Cys-rich membrane protein [Capnocytophaga sp.]|nr:FeoB-associated Cys-rich membrane protein [Capnocytophaga sp.]MDO5105344.1 FeoB-associated Cys-rich membrane protein [Capnocytophaga sp.]
MDIQKIIAYVLVVIAVLFLVRNFIPSKKKKHSCGSNDKNCKCN